MNEDFKEHILKLKRHKGLIHFVMKGKVRPILLYFKIHCKIKFLLEARIFSSVMTRNFVLEENESN